MASIGNLKANTLVRFFVSQTSAKTKWQSVCRVKDEGLTSGPDVGVWKPSEIDQGFLWRQSGDLANLHVLCESERYDSVAPSLKSLYFHKISPYK